MKRKILSLILVFAMTVSLLTVGTGAVEPTYGDTAGHWAESSIERWSAYGIIQGSNGQFDPNGQLTCAQLATILAKLLKLPAAKDAGFTDNTADAWYYDAINRCAAAGILNGNGDGTVTPEAPITRERAMVMLARALGIETGDIVCFDPRTHVTASGYIKSRFLDDKLSVGILLGFAKYLRDEEKALPRHTYAHVTVYEEVGHGGCASVPAGVTESISVDMGCVGDGLRCTERQVSICAKDSGGPYSYEVVGKLIDAARREGADYAVDVYPHYGSDVEATLRSGYDIRHGLIGSGVYASHGAQDAQGLSLRLSGRNAALSRKRGQQQRVACPDGVSVLHFSQGGAFYGNKGHFARAENEKGTVAGRAGRKALCHAAGRLTLGKRRHHAQCGNLEAAFRPF